MTDKNSKSRRPDESDPKALAVPNFGFPSIFEDLMRPFSEFMQPVFPESFGTLWIQAAGKEPSVDLQDRGDHFVLTAELPGFDKSDVEVRIDSNAIELKAQRRSEKEDRLDDATERLSSYASFQRHYTLPEQIREERVVGTMKNGVLEVKLPKAEPSRRDRSRRVDLK